MITAKQFHFLLLFQALVYLAGIFIPLMQNDSAQHAVMAMRMHLENDFLHLYRGEEPYLDKPHLHFWLAALSYKLLGISQFSYRLPSLLITILAAYAVYRLAQYLYHTNIARLATLMFLSCQGLVLSNHDVRTDTILTGTIIWAIWQLVLFVDKQRLTNVLVGFFSLALAYMTKGMLGVVIVGAAIFWYIAYKKAWKILLSPKWWLGVLSFFIFSSPMLYAYYVQFGWQGVRFILWDQSFNRMSASGFEESSPDYFFFFHTLVWAFLPWSIMAYFAYGTRIKQLLKGQKRELLTFGGFMTVFIAISFSKFKLPHYLNGLFPILSIITAAYWDELREKREIKAHRFISILVFSLAVILFVLLCFIAFPIQNWQIAVVLLLMFSLSMIPLFIYRDKKQIFIFSFLVMAFINLSLNLNFYPQLAQYQDGIALTKIIKRENINPRDIYFYDKSESWTLAFYNQILPKRYKEDFLKKESPVYLFVDKEHIDQFEKSNIKYQKKYEVPDYRITVLSYDFLNPDTREQQLEKAYLLKLK